MEVARRRRTLGRGKRSWAKTGKHIPGGAQCRALREVVPRGAGPQQRQAELVTTSGLSSVSCSIRRPPSKTVCLVKQPKQPTKKIKLSDHTGGDHRPHHVTCAFVWLRNLFCYGFCYGIYFVLVKSTCSKGAVALFSSAVQGQETGSHSCAATTSSHSQRLSSLQT